MSESLSGIERERGAYRAMMLKLRAKNPGPLGFVRVLLCTA